VKEKISEKAQQERPVTGSCFLKDFSNFSALSMEEKINRPATIKAIAWTSMVFFSIAGYYVFANYFVPPFMALTDLKLVDADMGIGARTDLIRGIVTSGAIIVFFLFAIYGANGLAHRSINGLAIYHATTLTMIAAIIGFSIYYCTEQEPWNIPGNVSYAGLLQLMETVSIAVAEVVFIWLLMRANVLLWRLEFRKEFRSYKQQEVQLAPSGSKSS